MTDEERFNLLERYRVEGNVVIIEMALDRPSDIYDHKDPSPLRIRDFRKEVERYITDCILEIPKTKKIKIIFYFSTYTKDDDELLLRSYHDFFTYEIKKKNFLKRQKLLRGSKYLIIGFAFLFACVLFSNVIKNYNDSIFKNFFLEGLTILGWVTLWEPAQIFLYEILPIVEEQKVLERALIADVEFKSIANTIADRKYILRG